MMGGGGQGRPCKFGNNCNKFQQGTCTFLHDTAGNNQGNYNPQGGRGGPRKPPNQQFTGGNNFNNPNQGGNIYSNPNQGGNNIPIKYNNQGGMGQMGGGGQQQYGDNFSQEYCRFFQTSECQKGQHCKKSHEFAKGDILRRVMKTKDVPNNQVARLCMLTINGVNYFTLRLGTVVSIFQYNSEMGQINELPENFLLEYSDIHLFDAR